MNSRSQLLYLEDNLADVELLQDALQADGLACDVTCVDTESGFRAALQQDSFDLILADYTLPSFDGLSALRMARQQKPDVPFIFVSGTMGEEAAIEALKTGATDYVLKTRMSRLAPAVRRALREAEERRELLRAERELRERDSKIRRLVDANIVGIFSWDLEGQILEANDAFLRIVGYDREDLASGRVRWTDLTPPEWLELDAQQRVPELKATGSLQPFEKEYFRKDGSRVPVLIGVASSEESGNQGLAFVLDLTERKRAEQEREKLRQLEAGLAHINRVSMMGEMAASLAHEIKQPIAAAINSANSCITWLGHEPPNLERARAAATKVNEYGNRAAEIIDRIRSFYRKCPPQREFIDVIAVVHEILTLLQGEAARYSILLRSDLPAELPKINADPVQLQQVFMNLMLNAIEAMKDFSGEITVRSQLQGNQILFSVIDSGMGLPTENADRIFSAFYTTKAQGSGMGLAISRTIVESHGGRLWAAANDGRGATFHFTLPTQAAESALAV